MMEHTGVWARLALLLAALMLMCSFALAEEASLEILSCVQQGDQVVLNFVCLDEHNAQVALSLNAADWTVRGAESHADMRVDGVSRNNGGVHYIFVYETSAAVGSEAYNARTQAQCIEAMKASVDELKLGDSVSVVQLGKKLEIILNHAGDKAGIVTALNKLKKNSEGDAPKLYDQIGEALDQLTTKAGERTVMIILSTGIDSGSKLTKYELAQRLENAQVSVYPVLVKARNDTQSASGLEALCVRGGYMLQADRVKNQNEMVTFLKELLPAVRDVYTLTARATDASYNDQAGMLLRVFVRHNGGKISGEAHLTTDDRMYTVVSVPVAAATAAPQTVEPIATATVEPPVPQASEPAATVGETVNAEDNTPVQEEPEATEPMQEEQPAPAEVTPVTDSDAGSGLMTYILLGGGALVVLAAVVLVVVLVMGKSKKAKVQKHEKERPAASINPQFGVMKAGTAPAPTTASAKAEKPAESSKPTSAPAPTSTTNPADFFNSDPAPAPVSPPATVRSAPVQQIAWNMAVDERKAAPVQSTGWESTMDERQAQQKQPANLDVTQDERQVKPAQSESVGWPVTSANLDVTQDERHVKPIQSANFDVTRDERQVQPAGFDVTRDERPVQPAASAADQTVQAMQWEPHLILTITDANGTREIAKPLATGGEITLGRENTDILLDRHDHSISRSHLSIKLTASSLAVVDHSGNGTMVDGHLLRHGETRLTIGSEMQLGGLDEAAANRVATVIRVKEFRYPGATR